MGESAGRVYKQGPLIVSEEALRPLDAKSWDTVLSMKLLRTPWLPRGEGVLFNGVLHHNCEDHEIPLLVSKFPEAARSLVEED